MDIGSWQIMIQNILHILLDSFWMIIILIGGEPLQSQSPDMNPIENLWHELKEFIRREVKPRRKEELVEGILQFWETVDVLKCKKYIRHLRKVIPLTIELKGADSLKNYQTT